MLPRARAATRGGHVRPARARRERGLQPALGPLPVRLRGRDVGGPDALLELDGDERAPVPASCLRSRRGAPPRGRRPRPGRRDDGGGRAAAALVRLARPGRSGRSGSTARSRPCGASRPSSYAATSSSRCRALLAERAAGRARRVVFQTAVLGYLGDAAGSGRRQRSPKPAATAPLAFVWTDRPAPDVHTHWGLWLRLWPGGEPELARRTPTIHGAWLDWLARDHLAANPTLKLVRKLLAQKRKRDELGPLRGRGRGSRRRRRAPPGSSRSSCSWRARR